MVRENSEELLTEDVSGSTAPNDAIVAEFEAAFDKVAVVGDTVEPGNIADATHSGLNKAFVF